MVRRYWLRFAVLPLALVLAGCHAVGYHASEPPFSSAERFPSCLRNPLALYALARLPAAVNTAIAPVANYRCVSAHDAQCLAVQTSSMANALDLEAHAVQAASQQHPLAGALHHDNEAANFQVQILAQMALDDRNRSAAKALDAYYRLGEAEANADILAAMSAHVKDALTKALSAKANGLELPFDETGLERQLLDLKTNAAQLYLQIAELNSDLRRYLNLEPCPHDWSIWPSDAFALVMATVDCDEAVAIGLSHRSDLRILDLMDAALTTGQPEVVRKQLAALNSMLGQAAKAATCPCVAQLMAVVCGAAAKDAEMKKQAEQVAQLRAQRRRDAIDEIRQAVRTIAAQVTVVGLAQERVSSWQQRVRRLAEQEAKGVGSFIATSEARGEQSKAQRKLVEEITNLQRARVKLGLSQGVLPHDCLPCAHPLCAPMRHGTVSTPVITDANPALGFQQSPPPSAGAALGIPILATEAR